MIKVLIDVNDGREIDCPVKFEHEILYAETSAAYCARGVFYGNYTWWQTPQFLSKWLDLCMDVYDSKEAEAFQTPLLCSQKGSVVSDRVYQLTEGNPVLEAFLQAKSVKR